MDSKFLNWWGGLISINISGLYYKPIKAYFGNCGKLKIIKRYLHPDHYNTSIKGKNDIIGYCNWLSAIWKNIVMI